MHFSCRSTTPVSTLKLLLNRGWKYSPWWWRLLPWGWRLLPWGWRLLPRWWKLLPRGFYAHNLTVICGRKPLRWLINFCVRNVTLRSKCYLFAFEMLPCVRNVTFGRSKSYLAFEMLPFCVRKVTLRSKCYLRAFEKLPCVRKVTSSFTTVICVVC